MRLIEGLVGFKLIEDPTRVLVRQIRFPRSRRRRIRRKWALRPENNEFTPSTGVHVDAARKVVIAHPSVILRLKAMLAESAREMAADSTTVNREPPQP